MSDPDILGLLKRARRALLAHDHDLTVEEDAMLERLEGAEIVQGVSSPMRLCFAITERPDGWRPAILIVLEADDE